FAGAGVAMVGSRQALFAEISPDMSSVDEVAAVLPRIEAQRADLELWRDEAIEHITASVSAAFSTSESKAWMLSGLQDIRVRDTFLWDVAQPGADRPSAIASLTGVLRSAPEGYVAPVATVLAIQHWSSGDGARANACLDRAADDDPNYSLAALANTAISNGLPPTTWQDMMGALDRDKCRQGLTSATSKSPSSLAASTPAVSFPQTSPGLAG
ncbi:MAG: DUF4192 family protein, partial [Gammaproteobacteria bacterium]|nr:DUF4192 family protein [Gammaproteobacteria bacterium]